MARQQWIHYWGSNLVEIWMHCGCAVTAGQLGSSSKGSMLQRSGNKVLHMLFNLVRKRFSFFFLSNSGGELHIFILKREWGKETPYRATYLPPLGDKRRFKKMHRLITQYKHKSTTRLWSQFTLHPPHDQIVNSEVSELQKNSTSAALHWNNYWVAGKDGEAPSKTHIFLKFHSLQAPKTTTLLKLFFVAFQNFWLDFLHNQQSSLLGTLALPRTGRRL